MSLFYNNYQRLVQENNDAIAEISRESFKELQKMFKYMASFEVSLFELEVIKKDLIGVAREADIEGIDFEDKLGRPEKEFCDALLKDGIEHSRVERKILMVKNALIALFGYYALWWVMLGAPGSFGIPPLVVFFGLWDAAGGYVMDCKLRGRGAYLLAARKLWTIFLGGSTIIFIIAVCLMPDEILWFRGDGRVIFFILLALSACAFFGNNYYWDKCSEKYNWR